MLLFSSIRFDTQILRTRGCHGTKRTSDVGETHGKTVGTGDQWSLRTKGNSLRKTESQARGRKTEKKKIEKKPRKPSKPEENWSSPTPLQSRLGNGTQRSVAIRPGPCSDDLTSDRDAMIVQSCLPLDQSPFEVQRTTPVIRIFQGSLLAHHSSWVLGIIVGADHAVSRTGISVGE